MCIEEVSTAVVPKNEILEKPAGQKMNKMAAMRSLSSVLCNCKLKRLAVQIMSKGANLLLVSQLPSGLRLPGPP